MYSYVYDSRARISMKKQEILKFTPAYFNETGNCSPLKFKRYTSDIDDMFSTKTSSYVACRFIIFALMTFDVIRVS